MLWIYVYIGGPLQQYIINIGWGTIYKHAPSGDQSIVRSSAESTEYETDALANQADMAGWHKYYSSWKQAFPGLFTRAILDETFY